MSDGFLLTMHSNSILHFGRRSEMLLSVALFIMAMIGVIYGIVHKNKPLARASSILLIAVIAIWIYFYNNPY